MKLSLPLRAYHGRHRRPDPTGVVDEANEVLLDAANPHADDGQPDDLADIIAFAADTQPSTAH